MNIEQWITFAESGNQQKMTLQDNTVLKGWIMEVAENNLLFEADHDKNSPDKNSQSQWIDFAEIKQDTLFYFDTNTLQWLAFEV